MVIYFCIIRRLYMGQERIFQNLDLPHWKNPEFDQDQLSLVKTWARVDCTMGEIIHRGYKKAGMD